VKAIGCFEQALKIDSSYAPAWSGLSLAYIDHQVHVPAEGVYEQARQAAERALALDDSLAEAHRSLAWIKMALDWDWVGADAEYQKALALEPRDTTVIRGMAHLAVILGRLKQAIELSRQAVDLDPFSTAARWSLGINALAAGQLAEAERALIEVIELSPEYPKVHFALGQVYLARGQPEAALQEMNQEAVEVWSLLGIAMSYYASGRKAKSDEAMADYIGEFQKSCAYQIAELRAFRDEIDSAFEWLERAYKERDAGLAEMKTDWALRNLHSDPRWEPFLEKMGLGG
jgi:tetratricopeptide (TPR) repeat protein